MHLHLLIKKLQGSSQKYLVFLKWVFISSVVGVIVGLSGTAFHYGIEHAIETREKYPWIIWLLPVAGVIIVFLYKISKMQNDLGTNLIFLSIRSNAKVTIKTAPLIFISTILTHLCGGSAGREGAALQLGGSLSAPFGKLFRLDEKDKKILIMCGMSAGFSSLFGTPITAIIFSIEVLSVGIMYYSAILPCAVSSLVGFGVATKLGVHAPSFEIIKAPSLDIKSTVLTVILAIACSILGIIFCVSIKSAGKYANKYIKNSYIRIIIGGFIIIGLTYLVGCYDYNSAGMNIVANALNGNAKPEAFILKIIFTAVTLGVGFKGGEIVPVFFTGATFGNVFGNLIGLSPSFGAGIGLSALFCAVTNCPLTSILLSIELFGIESLPLFVIAIAVSYMLSGYYGLYSSQKIVYSKTKSEYIDINSL